MTKQDYGTPDSFITAVNLLWPICFDLAADMDNKVRMAYFTETDNALTKDWHIISNIHQHETPAYLWLNPPFRDFTPWAKKCREESEKGAKILMLAISSSTGWWRKYAEGHCLTLLLDERIKFIGCKQPYPKDLMLLVWGTGMHGVAHWNWKGKHS